MLQVEYHDLFMVSAGIECVASNLTFGLGGKDKDGVVTSGWGYYEVIEHLALLRGAIIVNELPFTIDYSRRLWRWP